MPVLLTNYTGPSTLVTLFNHKWPHFMAGIFIPVGTHYFQALTSTLLFVVHVCGGLWLVPATDRAFCGCVLCSAVSTLAIVSNHTWQRLSWVGNFTKCGYSGVATTGRRVQPHVVSHVAATCDPTCRPSVLGSAPKRGHFWLNKVASVIGP